MELEKQKIEENLVILKGDRLGEYWGNGPQEREGYKLNKGKKFQRPALGHRGQLIGTHKIVSQESLYLILTLETKPLSSEV